MNAIFGLFNLDGAPASAEKLDAMQAALAYWAQDAARVQSSGQAGLGCVHLPGTPQAQNERLPLVHAASGILLTAGARLDNRAALLERLELDPHPNAQPVSDAEIILQAYLCWGEDCVLHLDGDWHFAAWDAHNSRLFLARDPYGHTAIYYHAGGAFFAFASTKKPLLALDDVPKKPDMLRLCQVLVSWPGDGTHTGYEGILRLPPAHRMTVSADGVRVERYWTPENISPLLLKSDDDYVEAFMDSFKRAVSVRLVSQGAVGATLSGGLDSGSVTTMAARLLRERGESLVAFTATPLGGVGQTTDASRFGDETPLAAETARLAGNVEHVIIDAGQVTPLAGIEHMLWVHDEPGHAAGNQYWLAALLEAARRRGVKALLTGQMGNATISWAGAGESLLPYLLGGDLAGFRRAFAALRAGSGLGTRGVMRRFLLKPLLQPLLQPVRTAWQNRPGVWQAYSALRPEFARRIHLERLMRAAGHQQGPTRLDALGQRLRIIQPGQSILGGNWYEKGGAYGMEVRDPTQDRQLIELCLSIPEAQFQRDGKDRWLIRRAMQGYLPDAVRLNTRRGLQAADIGQRLLASREEVGAALARLGQHELASQVLDVARMQGVLASLEQGLSAQNTFDCQTILLRGLMTGLFLLRF